MVHHSISITSDDFGYFRRPAVVPLPWAAGCLGPGHYLSATTYNDVLRRPAWVSLLPLAPGSGGPVTRSGSSGGTSTRKLGGGGSRTACLRDRGSREHQSAPL